MTVKYKALPGRVLVHDMQKGERKIGGIVLLNDNGKSEGIRPRWCQVYSVGTGVTAVKEGEWILVAHGRWTRAVEINEGHEVFQVDWPAGVMAASDQPTETFAGSHVVEAIPLKR